MSNSLLDQAGVLPSLPEVYIRVNSLIENPRATAIEIGAAVQTDPALTARILKLVNSAYYGLRNPVTSIPHVVSLLGREQLQQVLLGSVLVGVCKDYDIEGFPMMEFWQHCIKTAIIARNLAMQNAQVMDHEVFFTAGLLHDIGWLVIAKVHPDSYTQITELAKVENRDVIEVETETLGVTHVQIGIQLLEKWGIPGMVTQCVKKHHDTDHIGPFAIETSIIYLANRLSHLVLGNAGVAEELKEEKPGEVLDQSDILATIPNWEKSKCTSEQISIACNLANEQWLEVMVSLGMAETDSKESQDDPLTVYTELDIR